MIFDLLILIGIILLLYFKFFIPAYLKKKGENLATKEDVSEITKLVEQVKISFIKETEHLKANLNFLTNIELSLFSEERSAIIDYNEKYFRWLNLLLDSSMNDTDVFNNDELQTHFKMLNNTYRDFLDSETRFNLFVKNPDLTKFTGELKLDTLKSLYKHPYVCIGKLKKSNLEWSRVKQLETLEAQSQKHSEHLDKHFKIIDEFRQKMLADYTIISSKCSKLQRMCREHLYQLIIRETE
ncbi:MAG TPA: hypothetical protein DEB37_10650 [Lysinibacillus sp.]|nr:hypothetical protein [Lysinibacillus sp.]